MGDTPMSQAMEMLDSEPRALGVVAGDDGNRRTFDPFAQERDAVADAVFAAMREGRRWQAAVTRDNAVDPAAEEESDERTVKRRLVLRVRNEHRTAAAGEPVADAGEDAGIERLSAVREEREYRSCAPHPQVPSRLVHPAACRPDRFDRRPSRSLE